MTSTSGFRWSLSPAFSALLLSLASLLLLGCGSGVASNTLSVSIPAIAGEDIKGPCLYDLELSSLSDTEKGIIVIFDRGDASLLYQDESVRTMARALKYALLFPHECDARSTGDLQADASQGPSRMLFAALNQFAAETDHHELANANLILYGFSAAGVLSATLSNEHPDRIIGTVQNADGDQYLDLETVAVTPAAAKIPTLILAGSHDLSAGTARSQRYFQRGRTQASAPWAFAVLPKGTHCCNLETLPILLPWLQAIATGDTASSVTGAFFCTLDGYTDAAGEMDCGFSQESLNSVPAGNQTVWLPNTASANAWLTWVTATD